MANVPRFFDDHAGSYFLFGPRGTGKSTWLRARYPDAAWIDLLDAETERTYYTRPERLTEFLAAHDGRRTVVIDEIQRVPELLPMVHRHIELDKSRRFVLTGSSARKLRREGVDLLAGRALLCSMHPFMAAELGDSFDLAAALRVGLVPLVVMAEAPDRTLRGYIDLYLQQQCLGADVIHVERRQQLPGAHHVAHRHRRDAAFEQRVDQKRRRAGLEPVRLEFVATQQQQSVEGVVHFLVAAPAMTALTAMGLTPSEAVRLLCHRIAVDQAFPLDPRRGSRSIAERNADSGPAAWSSHLSRDGEPNT